MQAVSSNLCRMCATEKGGWKCADCRIPLCNNCKVLHTNVPLCKDHKIVPAEETGTVIDREVLCEKHKDQNIFLNCRECEELICIKCKVTKHESHRTETIEATLERVLPEIEGYCEKIKRLIADIDQNKNELETWKSEVKADFQKCRKDAAMQLQKIIDRATEDYNNLMKELDIREEEAAERITLDRKKEFEQLVEWMKICTEMTKGVTLIDEIQSSLGDRMKELAKLETIVSNDYVQVPEMVLGVGNFSVEENVIGEIQYTTVKMLQGKLEANWRNPKKPFKDILEGDFKQNKEIKLKHWCKRISFIRGDIWAAVDGANCIQVIDIEGNIRREIDCSFKPYSVKQAPWGEIIAASPTGLHLLFPDGTVQSTICGDAFSDVSFFGEEIIGLNISKRVLQTYSRSGDGVWRHSGDIGASKGIGSHACDSVVTSDNEIVFNMWGNSTSHYYKCVGKTGQRMDFSSRKQAMNMPFVCGVDSTGAVLVAGFHTQTIQIHGRDDQWSVIRIDPISSHLPRDFLYDADTDTVWVLTWKKGCFLMKLERSH